MKQNVTRPNCRVCGNLMRIISTGSFVRTFYCDTCEETVTTKRDDIDEVPTATEEKV